MAPPVGVKIEPKPGEVYSSGDAAISINPSRPGSWFVIVPTIFSRLAHCAIGLRSNMVMAASCRDAWARLPKCVRRRERAGCLLTVDSIGRCNAVAARAVSSVLLTLTPLQETQQAAQALMNRPAQSGSAAAQSGRPAVIAPRAAIARQVCPPQRSNQRY